MKMIKLSDSSLVTRHKIIFTNFMCYDVLPSKYTNALPVLNKQKETKRATIILFLSYLPGCWKMLEKFVYDSLYSHFVSCHLLHLSLFASRPNDSTVNQLISINHTIFEAFDCRY